MIQEGGNIFVEADSIAKEDVVPTVEVFVTDMIELFPKAEKYLRDYILLGSTGRKDKSGDIDVGYDHKALSDIQAWNITKDQLAEEYKLVKEKAYTATNVQIIVRSTINLIMEQIMDKLPDKIQVEKRYSGRGKFHALIKQYTPEGNSNSKVQIDVIFGDPDWIKFTYYSEDYPDDLKGLHRTQLLHAMFSVKGYVFDHIYGVKDEESGKLLARKPEEAISLLENIYGIEFNEKILTSYQSLEKYLRENLNTEDYKEIIDNYIGILVNTRDAKIPTNIKKYVKDVEYR